MARLIAAFAACLFLASAVTLAAPPPIEAYGRLPATEFVALSPSGQQIAFAAVSGDTRRLVIRSVDGRASTSSDIGTAKVLEITWVGEDHVVLMIGVTDQIGHGDWGAAETPRSLVLNPKTKQTFIPFLHATDALSAVSSYYGARSVDGHLYGYFEGVSTIRKNAPADAMYRVDLDTGDYRLISSGSSIVLGIDGSIRASARHSMPGMEWSLYAGTADDRKLLSIADPLGEFELRGLGRTAGTILVERPDRPDGTLWEWPVTGTDAPVSLSTDPDVSVLHGEDGLAAALVFNDKQKSVKFFDPAADKKVALIAEAFAPNRILVDSWSTNFDRVLIQSSGADDPGTWYLVDVAAQKVEPIGKTYPGIGAGQIGAARMVSYTAGDGLKLEGVVTVPPGPEKKNRPLVVLPHGGPGARDYAAFDWWAQAFASRGYVVFQPNFRGSTGYGTALLRAGDGQWGRKMQTDISDGVAELARQGIVDAKRSCIVGGSYGGYAALAGVTVQHDLYRCAVSVGGVTDLNDLLEWEVSRSSRSSASVKYLQRQVGTDSFDDAALDAYSPLKQAAHADASILLIYGKDDTVVPTHESEAMAKALEKAGKPVQTVILKDEDHWLSREATRIQMLQEAVAFVEKNNPPG